MRNCRGRPACLPGIKGRTHGFAPTAPEIMGRIFFIVHSFPSSGLGAHQSPFSRYLFMPPDSPADSLAELTAAVSTFAEQRDWDQFHSPKNLSMALIVEAAELVEHFQWLSEEQSASLDAERKQAVGREMADILIYLIRLAERLDLELTAKEEPGILLLKSRQPRIGPSLLVSRRPQGDFLQGPGQGDSFRQGHLEIPGLHGHVILDDRCLLLRRKQILP